MNYLDEITKRLKTNEIRLKHTLGVADECVSIAKHYGLDVEKAESMGLLHDIAKIISYKDQENLMKQAGYDINMSRKIWHSYVGSYICEKELGIKDQEILRGIRYHTTCHPEMTDLMKVLMIADMTETRVRDEEIGHKLREISLNGLNQAIAFKLNWIVSTRDYETHPDTMNAYNKYVRYIENEE